MKKLLQITPQTVNLDESNDATRPILVEFESLFVFALEKANELSLLPKSVLNLVALVESILLKLAAFNKEVYILYVKQDFGSSHNLSLIKRIVLLHLCHEETNSNSFKLICLEKQNFISNFTN